MRKLLERNASVMSRLGEGVSSRQVAREFGLSATRVNQIRYAWARAQEAKETRVGIAEEVQLYSCLLNLRRITSKLMLVLEP